MFSSTTIASSMTMPTTSARARSVIVLSVNPIAASRANVLIIDVGMAIAAMNVERTFHKNTSTTAAASSEPTRRCSWTACVQAAADVRCAERISHQPGGIDQDVDLARLAADDLDLPHAARSLQARPDDLVGVLCDVPDGTVSGERQGDDRDGPRIEFGDHRRVDPGGEIAQDAVDLIPHLLCRNIDVLLQMKLERDDCKPFSRGRRKPVDPADGVHRRLDLVGNIALDLFGGGAGDAHAHRDERDVDVRPALDGEPRV